MGEMKIVGVCGSLRAGSYNKKLLEYAIKLAGEIGAPVKELDLKEYALPYFEAELELPENVKKFKKEVEEAHVLLIASPEYNYSIPGVLKNALDWLSRGGINSLNSKIAVIMGASTGPFGTVRAQANLRQVLACLTVMVLPQPQIFVPFAETAFNPDGSLKDDKTTAMLKRLLLK
ncbi:MAG: NAD(P)H-dependent oxidoreductase, partial [Candidatus Firestonebacteria bacterium]|nr:NAD(P)H-dependent oxidoreductase [Candidatus Firestonebacteria bacterium]